LRKAIILIVVASLLFTPICIWETDEPDDNGSDRMPPPTATVGDQEALAPSDLLGSLEGFFIENLGQFGEGAGRYYSIGKPLSVSLGTGWMAYRLEGTDCQNDARSTVVKIVLEGANPVSPQGKQPVGHGFNFIRGQDTSRWVTGARTYHQVVYEDLWDGVDMRLYFVAGRLKYDIIVDPGSDVSQVRMVYEGVDSLETDTTSGDLLIHTDVGVICDQAPFAYQDLPGKRSEVEASFEVLAGATLAFAVADYDRGRDLVIDPGLDYSTYIGGDNIDSGSEVRLDSTGNIYIAGRALSTNFPVTPGAYDTSLNAWQDIFILKMNPAGTNIIFCTFIGGTSRQDLGGLAIDAEGSTYITGDTYSADFPTTPGAMKRTMSNPNRQEGFILKLYRTGANLSYSTYLGGSGYDVGTDISVDAEGYAYVTGITDSTDFPTTVGAYDRTLDLNSDVFSVKLNTLGSDLVHSTFIGGGDYECARHLDMDSEGNLYITGDTASTDFPTTDGAFDTEYSATNNRDIFVTKLSKDFSSLVYSTFLGGSNGTYPGGLCVDGTGCAYVTGNTVSEDHPITMGAYDTTYNDKTDIFVTKLASAGDRLVFSTYVGSNRTEGADDICVDDEGNVYVTGVAGSFFPVTKKAIQKEFAGWCDAILFKLNSDCTNLVYSTYLGGKMGDGGYSVRVDSKQRAYVVGWTESRNFPVTGDAYKGMNQGSVDVFLVRTESLRSRPPTILDRTQSEVGTGQTLTFRVNATDDFGVMGVSVEYWYGGPSVQKGHATIALNLAAGTDERGDWEGNIPVKLDCLERISYLIRARDLEGKETVHDLGWVLVYDDTSPSIQDFSDVLPIVGRPLRMSILASDNHGISTVTLWFWFGEYSKRNSVNMRESETTRLGNGTYTYDLMIPAGTRDDLFYSFAVSDLSGNTGEAGPVRLAVKDMTPPVFGESNVSMPVIKGSACTFTVDVEDDGGVLVVHALIKMGEMQTENLTMEGNGPFTLTVMVPRHTIGPVLYSFCAMDVDGNWNTSQSSTFEPINVPPSLARVTVWKVTEGERSYLDLTDKIEDPNDPVHDITLECQDRNITVTGHTLNTLTDVWLLDREIEILLTDPDDTSRWTITLSVIDVNDPPEEPVIVSPRSGEIFKEGDEIAFIVTVDDPDVSEGQILTITWSSTLSGELWNSSTIDTFVTSELEPGNHIITIVVSDGEHETTSEVIILIEESKDRKDSGGSPGELTLLCLLAIFGGAAIWIRLHTSSGKLNPPEPRKRV
jgi:hypothetical protein